MNFRGKNIDLVGRMKLWFAISLAFILLGMIAWIVRGPNLGVDFNGGSQFTYRIPEKVRPQGGQEVALLEKVNAALEKAELEGSKTQIEGGTDLVVYHPANTQSQANATQQQISTAVGQALGNPKIAPEGLDLVGPVIGAELRRNAIWGVILGLLSIAAWIFIRYNFAGDGLRYAVAGIVKLIHDLLILLGFTALLGIEIDGAYIAAILTVIGYSINDAVVIFDRLRENLRLRRKESFDVVVNDSLLETMSRSINTGTTVLIMLLALLLFGGESLYGFILAIIVGIISGLYSSIFNAAMVLVLWDKLDQKKAAQMKVNRPQVTVKETSKTIKTR